MAKNRPRQELSMLLSAGLKNIFTSMPDDSDLKNCRKDRLF